jgi:hypothetical protein
MPGLWWLLFPGLIQFGASEVVVDFHLVRSGVLPLEDDTPLVVDANAVVAGQVAFQRL